MYGTIYHNTLLIESLILFTLAIMIFCYAYTKTLHKSYIYLAATQIFFLIAYISVFFTKDYSIDDLPEKTNEIKLIFSSTNAFLSIGSLFFVIALILIIYDNYNFFVILITLVVGWTVQYLIDFNRTELIWDDAVNAFTIKYDYAFTPYFIILFCFYLVYVIYYLTIKLQQHLEKHKMFDWVSVGALLYIIWIATLFFPVVKPYRPFVLPLSSIIIAYGVLNNPLAMLVSKYKPKELALFTQTNQLILRYDVKKSEVTEQFDEATLLQVSNFLIDEATKMKSRFHRHITSGGEILSMRIHNLIVMIIGKKITKNIESAIYFELHKLSKSIDFMKIGCVGILSNNKRDLLIFHLKRAIDTVCLSKYVPLTKKLLKLARFNYNA